MYEINPNKSKTDDLGIGQGLAQVIDPNLRLQYYKIGEEQDAREEARKQKQQDAEDARIAKSVEGLGTGVWQGVDDERIGKKINALNDYTQENIDKLRKGDIGAKLEFNNLKRDIQNDAAQSNKQMKDYYATKLKTANNLGNFYDDELEAFNAYGNTQREKVSDLPGLNQRFNTTKYYSDLGVKQKQEADQQGRKKAISPKEADAIIANDLTTNAPALIAESKALKATDEKYLNNLKTSQGLMLTKDENLAQQNPSQYKLADVTDFAQARHGKSIYGQWTTPEPVALSSIGLAKSQPRVTNIVTDNGGTLQIENPTDNPDATTAYIPNPANPKETIGAQLNTISYDKQGNILGGTATVKLTPQQMAENSAVEIENRKIKAAYDKRLQEAEALRSIGASVNDVAAVIPHKKDYLPQPLPYSEQVVGLPAEQAEQIAHGKMNVRPADILKGKTQGVNYQTIDKTGQTKESNSPQATHKQTYGEAKKAYLKKYNITEDQLDEKDLQYLHKFSN